MFKLFGGKPSVAPKVEKPRGLFSTHGGGLFTAGAPAMPEFAAPRATLKYTDVGMDDSGDESCSGAKPIFNTGYQGVPDLLVSWYGAQSFIGYQMCAVLSQHWLIDKACSMPGNDAIRNGYDLTVNDGTEVTPQMLAKIRKIDKRMRVKWHLQEYLRKGRNFGIRHLLFKVSSPDPEYYVKPFNIDGVTPGSYKGMVQIDPYWIAPELMSQNLVNPADLHFYEPEYWRVAGFGLVHRSHMQIFSTGQVPDVLKPSYFYGGVSIPQRIYERVYAAERTANEAPMLALTKRLNVLHTDLEEALANEEQFTQRMQWRQNTRDNYGTVILGTDDVQEQFDLTLTDFDQVVLTQYQLVAAIAEVPGTKLLGTQPKGFNSTGEFEEASYHERLETMQEDDLDPVLDRHYELVVRSYLPGITSAIEVAWNELDAMTALEQAQLNGVKAGTGAALVASGAIDSQDERNRLISDPDSGYDGLSPLVPPMPDVPDPDAAGGAGGAKSGTRAAAAGVAYKAPNPRAKAVPGA